MNKDEIMLLEPNLASLELLQPYFEYAERMWQKMLEGFMYLPINKEKS